MICPKCNKEGLKYLIEKERKGQGQKRYWEKRTDFKAKCNRCGWEGDIK